MTKNKREMVSHLTYLLRRKNLHKLTHLDDESDHRTSSAIDIKLKETIKFECIMQSTIPFARVST